MTYGRHLEQRKFGVYYFRQTRKIGGTQKVKRFSLKTKDLEVAKFLDLQFLANIKMHEINIDGLKKFEVEYDERGNIKRLKVDGEEDRKNFQDAMTLVEYQKAQQHQRNLEKLKFDEERALKEKQGFASSAEGQKIVAFKEKLDRDMAADLKTKGRSLETCVDQYLKNVQVTSGTLYKYQNYLGKLTAYAKSMGVTTIEGLDREFIFGYLLHLRNIEKKGNGTIKNTFNTLSTFHNFLITSGKTKDPNPFIGHNLNHEVERRLPFTVADLEAIFSSPAILEDKQLCFIVMLLVTSGARPNEICQLWTDDIQQDGKLHTIRIVKNEDRDQTLKTPDSKRVIYLNRLLIEAGFLEYVKTRKLGMLFDLKKPSTKTYSTFLSEKFSAILRDLKIKEKTLYCFRHTAINEMKQKLVKDSISEDLVGRKAKTVHGKDYPQDHSAAVLKQQTEKYLTYPQVAALQCIRF